MAEPTLGTLATALARVEERLTAIEKNKQPWTSTLSSLAAAAALVITIIQL